MFERGNAPAEFVLVSALLVALVLGLLQVVMMGYVRHVLTSAAAEGARQASLLDVSDYRAREVTRNLISHSLSSRYAENIAFTAAIVEGVPSTQVTVTAPVPILGLWSSTGRVEVVSHAPLAPLG